VQWTYANTETGAPAENILGLCALMLRAGQSVQLPVRSPAMVFHVNEGAVSVQVGNDPFALAQADTFCAPGYTPISLRNGSVNESASVFVADEAPLHQKLGVWESGGRKARLGEPATLVLTPPPPPPPTPSRPPPGRSCGVPDRQSTAGSHLLPPWAD
jgi:hypothetical protein